MYHSFKLMPVIPEKLRTILSSSKVTLNLCVDLRLAYSAKYSGKSFGSERHLKIYQNKQTKKYM